MPVPVDPRKVRLVLSALREAGSEGMSKERLRATLEGEAQQDDVAVVPNAKALDKLIERAIASLEEDGARIDRRRMPSSRAINFCLKLGPTWDEHVSGEARLALKLAAMTLSHTGTHLWHEKLEVIEKIVGNSNHMSNRDRVLFNQLDKAVKVYGGVDDPVVKTPEDILEPILRAFEKGRMVSVEYQAAGTDGTVTLEVSPYALTHDLFSGGTYLLVWDPSAKLPKPLRLNRVSSIKVLKTPAVITQRDKMERAVEYQIGAWVSGNPPFEVKVRISGKSWIQSLQDAPPDLRGFEMELEAGARSMVVKFMANKEEGAIRWILQFGSCAEVMEPTTLRERVKKELEKTLQAYC